ncbi:hypothetical protein MSSIH_2355 [Methanosarcina siciliae HI350]|uniref:Uncharacterized protein n=1 Tax=Methanosarcina siciliae HI350 TaxID=1434119 RepID=A0A0E3PEP0_9EURY|nr:hypothetical protein [Methanosarcina siciliae]AKB33045.1 hypothetical protein MSSIH_2355 [Methanosarcina siciliae HI350]
MPFNSDENLKTLSKLIINETYPNSDGYKGWFEEYPMKFDKEAEENFNFDFNKEKDIIALIFLATIWNMPNYRWENSVGLVAVLHKENLLDIEKWSSQSFIESLDKNELVSKMNNLGSELLGYRGNLYIKGGKDGVFQRLNIVAREYDFLRETLQIDEILKGNVPKLDHNIFPKFDNPRLMVEVKGKNNNTIRKPVLRVKVPLILRELKCCNKIEISGEYCCVPDTKVKQMMKIIGYNPCLDYDTSSVINNSKIIYKYFGSHYDLPLFDFSDKCSKEKDKECDKRSCAVFNYCAKL